MSGDRAVTEPLPASSNVVEQAPPTQRRRLTRLLAMLGPGLMVMLADTDAGSVITAAQSGAQYGYQLVLSLALLIPILYLTQEITARLGLVTGQGHGALIRVTFGAKWALLSAGTLFVACVGALITEFAGIAGVGTLVGLPRAVSIGAAALALTALILLGRYRRVEHVGIAIGALELLFIPAAFLAHPNGEQIWQGLAHPIQGNGAYLTLLAANVGAVIMPWMVFYQQEAVIDKGRHGLSLRQALRSARLDTAIGSVVTQLVMISVVIMIAATIGAANPGVSLATVGDIASGLVPFLGSTGALVFFGLGLVGAALVAALVVSLAGAWGVSEVLGWRHSLNDSAARAIGFYGLTAAVMLGSALLVILVPDLVTLSVQVEMLNACLLPVVLGFLLALERQALPEGLRMRGARRWVTYVLTGIVIAFGIFTTVRALTGNA